MKSGKDKNVNDGLLHKPRCYFEKL